MIPLMLVGLAVGWRAERGPLGALGAFGLLMLFRLATTWAGLFLGLLTRSEEAAGQLGSATFILPLLSNAYIPTDNLPGWLRTIAEWNPISARRRGRPRPLRQRLAPPRTPPGRSPTRSRARSPGAPSCCAVFVPLAVRRYANSGR